MFFRKKIKEYKEPPACVDCKFYKKIKPICETDDEHCCVHPKVFYELRERDIVTGEIIVSPAIPISCYNMRGFEWGMCGNNGKLFEKKEV